MEKRLGTGLIVMLAVSSVMVMSSCSSPQADFSAVEQDSTAPSTDGITSKGFQTYETTYNNSTTSSSGPVDMVWVIDNSGSMSDTAALVRSNFNAFLESVNSRSDIKVALISQPGTTGTSVTLPAAANNLQINKFVNSNDELVILSQQLALSPLKSFLRANSKKVFVIVTDDDSTQMSAAAFTSQLSTLLPNQSVTVDGFIALAGQSPCMARVGSVYSTLAQQTSGQTYNVCNTDWSSSFTSLADSVVQLANPQQIFPQASRVSSILSVSVNGQPVDSSRYHVTSTGLIFDASVFSGGSNRIVVTYNP